MRYQVIMTDTFSRWVARLKDRRAARAIARRIDRIVAGNLGDVKPVGGGVFEMRIFTGPGYRVYFCLRGGQVIVLLCGGDKSTQQQDIQRAIQMMAEL